MRLGSLKYIGMIVAVSAMVMGAADDCDAKKGKATEASYAGDGATMFVGKGNVACTGNYSICDQTGNGQLKFGKGYKAHYVDTSDRTNCEWTLYTINTAGKTTIIKKGGYLKANIKVEQTTRVQVWLKSEECGDWKPTS